MAKAKADAAAPRRRNKLYEFNGKSLTIKQWAAEVSISASALYQRLGKLGWDLERALTQPVRQRGMAAA